MRKSLRLAVLAGTSVLALALAAPALAAYTPRLIVATTSATATAGASTLITVRQERDDDPTARIVIYAPAGFTATLTQAPGTQIGNVRGNVVAGQFAGAVVAVQGTVTVGSPSVPAIVAAATACTGQGTHEAVWLLNVTAAGQSLPAPVPLFVDHTTGAEQAFGSVKIQLCLPPPQTATFGIKLVEATLALSGVFSEPAAGGEHRWSALFTPYTAAGTVNPAGTVQSQAIVRTPTRLSLNGRRLARTRKVGRGRKARRQTTYSARLTGQLRAGTQGIRGATVEIFVGRRRVARATTGANGSFRVTLRLARTTSYQARASIESATQTGGCNPPIVIPRPGGTFTPPCTAVTTGGFSVTSNTVRMTVRAKRTGRKR